MITIALGIILGFIGLWLLFVLLWLFGVVVQVIFENPVGVVSFFIAIALAVALYVIG
jgi:hypothetical protein